MICPECKAAGLTSNVYPPNSVFRTAMGVSRYYDEGGKLHVHDGNYTSEAYHCSHGHSWDAAKPNRCPSCDWTGGGSYTEFMSAPRPAPDPSHG